MENRLNGNDANLRIVSVDHAPITDSKPRQVARPLQPLHIALIQLDIAVNRLDHPNAGGPVKPLQVAKRAIRIGRAFTQMPSSLFTSSEVWVRPAMRSAIPSSTARRASSLSSSPSRGSAAKGVRPGLRRPAKDSRTLAATAVWASGSRSTRSWSFALAAAFIGRIYHIHSGRIRWSRLGNADKERQTTRAQHSAREKRAQPNGID